MDSLVGPIDSPWVSAEPNVAWRNRCEFVSKYRRRFSADCLLVRACRQSGAGEASPVAIRAFHCAVKGAGPQREEMGSRRTEFLAGTTKYRRRLGLRRKVLFDRACEHQPSSELIRDSNGHRASGARVWVSVAGYAPA